MNSHLTDEELIGNIHRTLTDAQREAMDRHLTACPHCRARLADQEALQQRIRNNLLADLRAVQPSPGMRFAGIAPQVQGDKNAALWRLSRRLFPVAVALTALIGLGISLMDLPESIVRLYTSPKPTSVSSISALACVFFAIAAVGNYRESQFIQLRSSLFSVLAFILWAGTAIVGLQVIVVVRDVLFWIVAYVSNNAQIGLVLSSWALIPLSFMWIAVVIGGGEYHYKRLGQRSSWQLFGWTIVGELCILVLSNFI